VSQEEGLGSFSPRLDVEEAQGQAIVRVYAEEAVNLEAAYLNLAYDSGTYTPNRVEFTEFIGGADEVLTLALTSLRDVVPLGAAQIAGRGEAANGEGLLATVYFDAAPFVDARSAAGVPQNTLNAVDDLKIIDQAPGNVTLSWTEKNVGDYDNNGEVTISDLTPIALLYGQLVATSPDPVWAGLVDGDGNGEINSADITPIGVNFGNQVAGYAVYTNEGGTELIAESGDCTCDRANFFFSNKVPVAYLYGAESEGTTFTVRPVDLHSGGSAGVLSNVAKIVNVPGPPDAPTNLVSETGETVGAMSVQLNWTASTHEDVSSYEIERKLSSDGDGAWAKIQQVSASTLGYTDTDPALTEDSFDYRVRAKDLTELFSDYSNVVSATPWSPPPPSPPENLTSTNEITTGNAIELNWDPPGDSSALKFNVYCQGPGETEFSLIGSTPNASITTYLHTGLTEFETYEYHVTSFGAGGVESVPSNTTSNTPSGASAITIESLTTDKTTHYADGGDANPATIEVTTSIPPDSVDWDVAPTGSVTGSGTTVTYKPAGGTTPQVITITCTVHKGTSTDVRDIKMYLTSATIKTSLGDDGKFVDWSLEVDYLKPLSQGGDITTGSGNFADFFADQEHVVIFDRFELW
jgi:hypothetical protein